VIFTAYNPGLTHVNACKLVTNLIVRELNIIPHVRQATLSSTGTLKASVEDDPPFLALAYFLRLQTTPPPSLHTRTPHTAHFTPALIEVCNFNLPFTLATQTLPYRRRHH
jgi:hypothetical protein